VQAICATGFEGRTPIRGATLTKHLVLILEEFRQCGASLTFEELSNVLANRMRLQGGNSVCPIPITYSRRGQRSIQLACLPAADKPLQASLPTSNEPASQDFAPQDNRSVPQVSLTARTASVNYYEELRSSGPVARADSWEEDAIVGQTRKVVPVFVPPSPLYVYDELQRGQIRYLKLHYSDDRSSELICEICIEDFPTRDSACEKYAALSYRWFQDLWTSRLRVLGPQDTFLLIPPNLEHALRDFRMKTRTLKLWYDPT
jgi:hypothetical protein